MGDVACDMATLVTGELAAMVACMRGWQGEGDMAAMWLYIVTQIQISNLGGNKKFEF